MKGCLTEDFQGSETGVYGMVVDVCHQTPVKGTELEQKARAVNVHCVLCTGTDGPPFGGVHSGRDVRV